MRRHGDTLSSELAKASKQVSEQKYVKGKVVLSTIEKVKWPFTQPKVQDLRLELRESKITLLLILSVSTIAHAEILSLENQPSSLYPGERERLETTIISLQKVILSPQPSRPDDAAPQTPHATELRGMGDVGREPAYEIPKRIERKPKNRSEIPDEPENTELNPSQEDLQQNETPLQNRSSKDSQDHIRAISSQSLAKIISKGSGDSTMQTTRRKEGFKGKWRQLFKGQENGKRK
ncbi:hypothetical protein MMC17_009246, partial [Xylographa soralifera]|nr:hypothetical protein [Xylographa soralifera]